MTIKTHATYSFAVWVQMAVRLLSIVLLLYFWRAVFANGAAGGLGGAQTITYVIVAQSLFPLLQVNLIAWLGRTLHDGGLAHELLRPMDFQGMVFARYIAEIAASLLINIPFFLVVGLSADIRLPSDPAVWGMFLVSFGLGLGIMFFFDWLFACLAFYTTEVWGLNVLKVSLATFLSGALVPLVLMPGWLRAIAEALPLSQSLAVPVAILSAGLPQADIYGIWGRQLLWLVALGIGSRALFKAALRNVTIQGG
jgi:ABC-2 type transport system permease protein